MNLQIGKVTEPNGTLTEENKIPVEISVLDGEKSTIWAYLSNVGASSGLNTFFIPEVGDEVIVGFLENDSNQAIILGSLYNFRQQDEGVNKIKTITTPSNLKIEFDEEKNAVKISTPANNTIEISDDAQSIKLTDQSENKIEMTPEGIVIDSTKAIRLRAKTNIIIESDSNLNMKSKSNTKIESTNIEVEAKAQLTAKGTAKAELSAAGQTVVKGAMVMIN